MKKTNKSAVIVFVLLLLVAVTAMMVASTYAKYTAEVNGTGTVTVAKWAFEDENDGKTLTVELAPTVDESTVVDGKIAPGTSGKFEVELTNAQSEVGVDFKITLGDVTGKPTNLKFYKDSSYTTELTSAGITGQLAAKDGTALKVPVYWKWAYETDAIATNDPIDTSEGEAAGTLSVELNITGVQTPPSATAITSHVN